MLPHSQPPRTLSIFLIIERNRSDRNCSFCPIRQLEPSLYLNLVFSLIGTLGTHAIVSDGSHKTAAEGVDPAIGSGYDPVYV